VATRRPGARYVDSDTWLAAATPQPGSWWPEWTAWLQKHSGHERGAPPAMGAPSHGATPLAPAPGLYVYQH
jgi:polyhydroxyalkanoate synthase